MSIGLILFFPLVSNFVNLCNLKEMKFTKSVGFFMIVDLITQEKIQKQIFFFFGGGGGIICQSSQTSC